MRVQIVEAAALLYSVVPLYAQADPPAPAVAPESLTAIGLALLGGLAVLAVEASRRYINGRIDVGIERERNRIEQAAKTAETESSIRLATITADQQEQHADAESLRLLAGSIDKMTTEIGKAYQSLATDRQQARDERKEFRVTLKDQGDELKRQAAELIKLNTLTEMLVADTKIVQDLMQRVNARIGGDDNDPSITRMLAETIEAVKQATELAQSAADAARPLAKAPESAIISEPTTESPDGGG